MTSVTRVGEGIECHEGNELVNKRLSKLSHFVFMAIFFLAA
jgi:hypothetical protein